MNINIDAKPGNTIVKGKETRGNLPEEFEKTRIAILGHHATVEDLLEKYGESLRLANIVGGAKSTKLDLEKLFVLKQAEEHAREVEKKIRKFVSSMERNQ